MDALDPQDRIARVFRQQRELRWALAKSTARERVEKLTRLELAILRHEQALCDALQGDFGKPVFETLLTEVFPVLVELKHTRQHLRGWMKPKKVAGTWLTTGARGEIRYEPKGQVLVLAPWNYPFQLAIAPLIGAIAAGNTVMLKPSEKTPRTARLLATLLSEVFGEAEVAVFEGDATVAEALLAQPFDHVFFTGSTRVGRKVMAAAAKHLSSVTLELGGKSPTIVDASADVAKAASRIVWGKFLNAGQTCIAPDHVFVHASIHDRFVEAVKAELSRAHGPTPQERLQSPALAKLIDAPALARLRDLVERSVAGGASLVAGGEHDAEKLSLAPTVLTGVTAQSAVMEEELFGPVLPVLSFQSRDEVYRQLRAGPKPLALYLFAEDKAVVEEVLASTTAGGSCINNVLLHLTHPNLPFGGVGESGLGSYHGERGFQTFSHERSVFFQKGPNVGQMLFPPYGERHHKRLSWLRKL